MQIKIISIVQLLLCHLQSPAKTPCLLRKLKLPKNKDNPILCDINDGEFAYFVHSYHAIPVDSKIIAAQVDYGSEKLTAMIENDNLLACQFHPEKSGKTGEKLLRRWLSNIQ